LQLPSEQQVNPALTLQQVPWGVAQQVDVTRLQQLPSAQQVKSGLDTGQQLPLQQADWKLGQQVKDV